MTQQTLTPKKSGLDALDQTEVAFFLSSPLIRSISEDDGLGGTEVATRLAKLRELMWRGDRGENKLDEIRRNKGIEWEDKAYEAAQTAKQNRAEAYKHLLKGLNEAQTERLAEGYAKLGQLYEIAGQVAKENFFKTTGKRPGGIADVLHDNGGLGETAAEAVALLNKPVFEPILTQHPTNVNTLEAIKLFREIGAQANARNVDDLNNTIEKFSHVKLTPEKDGKPSNFTVYDETQMIVNFLGNIYDDLPKVYAEFDAALAQKYDDYTPEALHLNLNIGSWGSAGDKDGNDNIKCENTLEAVALHRKAILERYAQSLDSIPQLAAWKTRFEEQSKDIGNIIDVLEFKREFGNDIALTQAEFDDYAERISVDAALVSNRAFEDPKQQFLNDINTQYASAEGEEKQALLDLKRRVNTFGFGFGKIEYRETAEAYSVVMDTLIPELRGKEGEERTLLLTDMLQNHPEKLQQAAADFLAKAEGDKLRVYKQKHADGKPVLDENGDPVYNADVITYHTLKRMQLARDFSDMFKDNVLAECQGTHNLLEAVALQVAVKTGEQDRAKLGVVPLFEEHDTLTKAPKILEKAIQNPAYQQHLREVYADGEFKQQVQIAHSDNARRSGVAAARGFIHEAHETIRAAMKDQTIDGKPVTLQFFQGGSQSDSYRNGVRAISAMVNAFDIHDFAKMTFQGGDVPNYFNQTTSIVRLLERQFAHSAKGLKAKQANPDAHAVQRNEVLEKAVTQALKDTIGGYQDRHFNESNNQIGRLFAHPDVDFLRESQAQNVGSRAAARASSSGAQVDLSTIPVPVDTKKMRTIGFSECFSGALGMVASWIGAEHLFKKLGFLKRDMLKSGMLEAQDFDAVQDDIAPSGLAKLYDKSPSFKDTIDKLSYAIMMSDMSRLNSLNKDTASNGQPTDNHVREYIHKLNEHYCQVADLVYQSMSGEKYPHAYDPKDVTLEDCKRARFAIKHLDKMQYLEGLDPKQRYAEFAMALRDNEHFNTDLKIRRSAHSATDTVYHGRSAADDPRYAWDLSQYKQQQQSQGLAA